MKHILYFILLSIGFYLVSCEEKKANPDVKLSIDKLVQKYPDSIPILIKYSETLYKRYNVTKALNYAAKAYRLNPKDLEARYIYAKCLNNYPKRTGQDIQLAQDQLLYYIKRKPKNPEALVQLAGTYKQQNDFEKAFKYVNEALRVDKHYRDAYILKGTMYQMDGNYKLAKSSYITAIEQDPDFYVAYLEVGTILQMERDTMCIQYFRNATEIKPKSTDAWFNLAYAYQDFNQSEKALEVYRHMHKIDPKFAMSLFQQGWIKQFQQNQLDSAVIFYNETLQTEPRFVEAWHNLGVIYEETKDPLEAMVYYKRALKYDKDFELSIEAIERITGKKAKRNR